MNRTEYPKDLSIPHYLEETIVSQHPDQIAIKCGKTTLTYRELEDRANQFSRYLQERGVHQGDCVGIALPRSDTFVISALAILKVGAAYVPIDPSYPVDRKKFMIEDADIKLLITNHELKPSFSFSSVPLVIPVEVQEKVASHPTHRVERKGSGSDLLVLNYTSGSTGTPKGVEVLHRNAMRLVVNTDWIAITPQDRVLHMANTSFDATTFEIWGALLNGATLCIYPSVTIDLAEFHRFLAKEKISIALFTAKFFSLMADQEIGDLHHLRVLISGGDAMSAYHAKKALLQLPQIACINAYGPTENGVITTTYQFEAASSELSSVPIGKAIANTSVYILDDRLQQVQEEEIGEIYAGGDGLARGYKNRPELTQEKFIENPFAKGQLYKTGDLGRFLPDGNIEFLGRIDSQVKIRGYRIEPGEIENTLREYEKVKDAAVTVLENPAMEKVLVAYIVPAGKTITEEIRKYALSRLPEYMAPTHFLLIDHIPLTHNGKIDLKALPSPFETHDFKGGEARTPTEQLVKEVWAQILGFTEIGREDHFFRMGGDSIKAMEALIQLKKKFRFSVEHYHLFKHPVLKDFAKVIAEMHKVGEEIPKRPIFSPVVLSENQESLWVIDRLNPTKITYQIYFPFLIEGPLDENALLSAFKAIIHRHEALRTRFEEIQGTPQQVIEKEIDPIVDTRQASSEREALDLLEQEKKNKIDITKSPLIRLLMIRLGKEKHYFLVTVHHIVFDGWSSDIFFKEWREGYQSLVNGKPPSFPPLAIQYGDFALWQRKAFQLDKIQDQIDYWKEKLQEAPQLLEMAYDFPRPQTFTGRGDVFHFNFSPGLHKKIEALAKTLNATYFIVTLAAFYVLLSRLTGKTDVLVGTPYANRKKEELEYLIGYFIQMLVLRQQIKKELPFSEFVKEIMEMVTEAYHNSDVSFENLVRVLDPPRSLSFNPFFQIAFSIENAATRSLELETLKSSPLILKEFTSHMDLYVALSESEGGYVEYCTDLFKKETVKSLIVRYEHLLEEIVANPHREIGRIPLLSEEEKKKMVVDWNENRTDFLQYPSLAHAFEAMVASYPDNIALKYNEQRMTYRELDEKANQMAALLKNLGVKKQDFIGLSMDKSPALIITTLAIVKLGAIYVPIDINYPEERKQFIIEDTHLKLLIVQEKYADRFQKGSFQLVSYEQLERQFSSSQAPSLSIDPDDLAYIMYTSGSTGNPKGVEITHRGILRLFIHSRSLEFFPEDNFLFMSNISFDGATYEIWGALLNGASLSIYPYSTIEIDELHRFLLESEVTVALFSAKFFTLLADQKVDDLKEMRVMMSIGDIMSIHHTKKMMGQLPQCQIYNGYGPTENTACTTLYRVENLKEIENGIPIGKAISNTSVYILDEYLEPVPIGVAGLLFTGGDGLARGYLHRPDLTSEKFIPSPFGKGKLYNTGDVVRYLPDGNIFYIGRMDNQVKIRGFRIELGEVEEAFRKIDVVTDSAAVVWEEIPGDKKLVSYVECTQPTTSAELRKAVALHLPEFMMPSLIFVLDKLPINPSGKIDRKKLPPPSKMLQEPKEGYLPPESSTEQLVADIWSSLLGIEKIGREDHFFHLGGHSINSAQLASVLSKTLNTPIPANLVFEYAILSQYAKKIDELLSEEGEKVKHPLLYRDLFWIWRNKETKLASDIGKGKLAEVQIEQFTHPKEIFLTGVTGFVGAFLLQALLHGTEARIHCHVRASSKQEAQRRIQEVMEKYEIYEPEFESRIEAVAGDLEKKLLGIEPKMFHSLAETIDSIFHSGAYVNHVLPYAKLRAANVLGTEETIRLALTHKKKPLHYLSTVAVFDPAKEIKEDDDIRSARNLFNGYAQSKWVGERMIEVAKERGLLASIYRLSRVSGSSKTGSGPTSDFLWRTLQASLLLKLAPHIVYEEAITPVDFVAEALVYISKKPEWIGKHFHLLNTKEASYLEIFKLLQRLGYPLEMTSYEQWRQTLIDKAIAEKEERLSALVPLFTEFNLSEMGEHPHFRTDHLEKALRHSGISCPSVDEQLFKTYLAYYKKIGFI